MKNKIFLVLLACGCLSLSVVSCIDDKGNYDYKDVNAVMPVTISGMRDTIIKSNTVLNIIPEIKNADSVNYSYTWYVMEEATIGVVPVKRVLSDKPVLDVPINLQIGKYLLNLEVRNKANNVYVREEVNLTVIASVIYTGWYVLKDENDLTNLDYINLEGTYYRDLLPTDHLLPGTAVKIVFQSANYTHQGTDAEGNPEMKYNQQAFHVLSSRDIKTFNAADMTLFKNYEDQFYLLPDNCRPQSIYIPAANGMANGNAYLVNDGKVYTIFGMGTNVGKYVLQSGAYTAPRDMIVQLYIGENGQFFDNSTATLYAVSSGGTAVRPVEGAVNMDYTMENLLFIVDNFNDITAVGIMKHRETGDYYYATLSMALGAEGMNPFKTFDLIPSGSKVVQATHRATPSMGSYIYFTDEHAVYAYQNADIAEREQELFRYPDSETIAYITRESGYDAMWNPYEYLAVLTNSAAGWKLYIYNAPPGTPDGFNATPITIYEGTGNARYVMYRLS